MIIGSISSGTLRPQDLLPTYLETLSELAPAKYIQLTQHGLGLAIPSHIFEDDGAEWWMSEECAWILESIVAALEECAAPYTYFGSLEGDGADIGFWPDLEEAMDDPYVHVGDSAPADDGICAWLEINERGNLEYRERQPGGSWEPVWSCV